MGFFREKIASRMRIVRMLNHKTQEQMGDFLGTTQEQYYLYESGKRAIKAEDLANIADVFNVSLDFLTGLTDEYRTPNGEKIEISETDNELIFGTGRNMADFLKYHPES